jgi:hypothetical protein
VESSTCDVAVLQHGYLQHILCNLVNGANKETTQNAYILEMFVSEAVFLTEVTVAEWWDNC